MKVDKHYAKIALYAFLALGAVVLLENTLQNLGFLSSALYFIVNGARKLISPFIIGFSIAYLMSPCVNFFERTLFAKFKAGEKFKTSQRVISIIITYTLFFGALTWIMTYFIPEIKTTLTSFVSQLPRQQVSLENTVNNVFDKIDYINSNDVNALLDALLKPIFNSTQDVPKMFSRILGGTVVAASTLLNIILGIFIAFYMLMDKEKTGAYLKKVLYVFCPEKSTTRFLGHLLIVHQMFKNFIVGKTLDSTIIGIICFAGMSLMNAPYVMIISLIIGVTNMIPYFGPFIGAVPAVLMTLLVEPSKAIWVALFILALQQFDGIILGPKILGDSTGLKPIWIIFSIIVGGAILGPLGMFLGVPVVASVRLFFTEYINAQYEKKFLAEQQNTNDSQQHDV